MTAPTDQLAALVADLGRYSHSSHVLTSGTALESTLVNAILTKMRRGLSHTMYQRLFTGNGPLTSFYAKIDVAFALGILDENGRADFHFVRDIRNMFAHPRERMDFDHKEIASLLLGLPKNRRTGDNLQTFNQLVTDCFTHLLPILRPQGLLDALVQFVAAQNTSPETSDPPLRPEH